MKKRTSILLSDATTKAEKKERSEIVDAILKTDFAKEPEEIVIVEFSDLNERIRALLIIPTRAKWEDEMLRNYQWLFSYMCSHALDVIVGDDITECN